jgi:hypothetical protein
MIYAYDDKAAFGAADPIGRFAYTEQTGVSERTASIASFVSRLASLRNRPALAAESSGFGAAPSRPHQDPSDVQASLLEEHRHELEIDEWRSSDRRPAALLLADRQRFLDAHLLSGFRSRFPNLGDLEATLRARWSGRKRSAKKCETNAPISLSGSDRRTLLPPGIRRCARRAPLRAVPSGRDASSDRLARRETERKPEGRYRTPDRDAAARHLLPQRGNALAVLLEE